MKRVQLLITFTLFATIINAQTGSVSGNVFWKYNDFVGNKADAGSEVSLISLTSPDKNHTSMCDLQGNYKIDGVQPGRYFLIIKSKNTRQDPIMYTRLFNVYKFQLDTVIGINISSFRTDLQNQIDSLYKMQFENIQRFGKNEIKMAKYFKEEDRLKKEMLARIKQWFEVMPSEQRLKLNIASYIHDSFHYQIVDVQPNKNETIVTDFGNTYL